jgi:hypothetical protein
MRIRHYSRKEKGVRSAKAAPKYGEPDINVTVCGGGAKTGVQEIEKPRKSHFRPVVLTSSCGSNQAPGHAALQPEAWLSFSLRPSSRIV